MTHHEHPDVALVRRGYEAFATGNVEALNSMLTSDCTHHTPGNTRFGGHFKGRDNILANLTAMGEYTGGGMRVELHDVYVDGRGHALGNHTWFAERGDRGIEMKGAMFFTIIDGKISDVDELVADIEEADAFWSLDD